MSARPPIIIGALALLVIAGIIMIMSLTRQAAPEATPFVYQGGGSTVDFDLPLTESAVITSAEGGIYSFGFSPDASRLIVGQITKLTVWDVAAGGIVFEPPSGGAEGNINEVAYSPDGRYLMATIGYCVNQYDANSGEYMSVEFCDIGPRVRALAFSPDGRIIAGAGRGSILGLWDMESHDLLWQGEEQEVGISDIDFSPDGSMIASAAGDASVCVWDVADGTVVYRVEVDAADLWDVDFSPAGDQGAVGASNGTVTIFDAATGDEITHSAGNGDAVYSLAYSPDGSLLAIGTEAGLITLYDTATGESISEWQAHDGMVTQLTWLDGSVLVSSGVDGKLVFWQ
jgi:WD40 repeat protein